MNNNDLALMERRLQREKSARKQAETFLESKSLELYETNQKLNKLAESLEDQVRERTGELKVVHDKAMQASRAKTNFLATMSHEIRTPLNGIIGMIDMLQDTSLTNDQEELVNLLRSSSKSMRYIVNDILDLSKIESGKFEILYKPFWLSSVVDDVVNSMATLTAQKHLELLCIVDKDIPDQLYGDPLRLRQILLNLMGNATKYTDEGYILLRVTRRDLPASNNRVPLQFEVIDTGIGIAPDDLKNLFNPFSQASNLDIKMHEQGTGLGLTISKKLIQLMNGRISVDSELGTGSCFRVELNHVYNESRAILQKPINSITFYQPLKAIRGLYGEQFGCITEKIDSCPDLDTLFQHHEKNNQKYKLFIVDAEHLTKNEKIKLSDYLKNCTTDLSKWVITQNFTRNCSNLYEEFTSTDLKTLIKPLTKNKLKTLVAEKIEKKEPLTLAKNTPGKYKDLSILLVEDNPVNQMVAKALLKKYGIEVQVASDGLQAIEYFKQSHFNLILMDINMPRMGGVEATKILKEIMLKENRLAPVIALTAYDINMSNQNMLQDMDGFLAKPINKHELIKQLDKWTAHLEIPVC